MNSSAKAAPPLPTDANPDPLPGFEHRTFALREHLDGPTTYADYRAAMLDMTCANKLTRAFDPFLRLLRDVIASNGVGHATLKVLDLGCGQGDVLRALHRWAAPRSIPLHLTGIDLHPYALRLAVELDQQAHTPAGTFHWIAGDAITHDEEADIITCSLMAHHLSDDNVVALLQRCDRARQAWLISDLRRSKRAAGLFRLIARILRWHRFVREDGDVSFRRAFSLEEWRSLVVRAGVDADVIDAGGGRILIRRAR